MKVVLKNSRLAVTAGTVELAKALNAEGVDLDGTGTVVLDDLVVGVFGTTTDDVGLTAGLLDGDSVLADVFEPNVVKVARAKAVYSLSLVGADNDVSVERVKLV